MDGKVFLYKGKPLVRRGNMIYYGDPKDRYIILFIIKSAKRVEDLDVSTSVTIQLQTNDTNKPKVIKQAEREGLYAAMDIAEYWLMDALENH
jgi:hypothetical protein